MMLRTRLVITSVALALAAAFAVTIAVERVRAADLRSSLDRVVRSQINEAVRERCEEDPTWFLTGPLIGRPPHGVFVSPDPDQLPPRPRVSEQPFELFAYDDNFIGSSSATPRMPVEMRNALRVAPVPVVREYETPNGIGAQIALPTGWSDGVCAYFMGRLAPPPGQRVTRAAVFGGTFLGALIVALAAGAQTTVRIRRLARATRASIKQGYGAIAPDRHRDELSSFTFAYNDAAEELRQRRSRIDDQNAALHRLVRTTEDEIGGPLVALTGRLGALASGADGEHRSALNQLLRDAHDLTARVENLAAAARLRMSAGAGITPTRVDLNALTHRVAARFLPVAHAAGVGMQVSVPDAVVTIDADAGLVERALANVVDNAIRYNQSGGQVTLTLSRQPGESRFRLWVADNGPGVSEEHFRGLTAIRRFRGDEDRNRRPNAPGLGLAIAREVADRFGLQFDLKRPGVGGFEAEFSGAC